MASYKLNNSKNVSDRIDFLKMLIDQAEAKGNHLDKLRQANFSVTLFIFAGLIGFGLNQDGLLIRSLIILILILFMIILSVYDNDLHKYVHGWRRTKVRLIIALSGLLNDNDIELSLQTYYKEGEEQAKKENCDSIKKLWLFMVNFIRRGKEESHEDSFSGLPSRMRVFFYLVIRGAFLSVIPFLLIKTKS